jgi:hypothetical protein
MTIEVKRKKVELLKVSAAKADLELRIHERLEEIERLKEHITKSEETEVKLAQEIKELENK